MGSTVGDAAGTALPARLAALQAASTARREAGLKMSSEKMKAASIPSGGGGSADLGLAESGDGAGAAPAEPQQSPGDPRMAPHPGQGILGSDTNSLIPHVPLSKALGGFPVNSQDSSQQAAVSIGLLETGIHHQPALWLLSPEAARLGRGQRPHSDPVAGSQGDPRVPAPKLSLSPCQALLTGDMQATETGFAQMGRKVK